MVGTVTVKAFNLVWIAAKLPVSVKEVGVALVLLVVAVSEPLVKVMPAAALTVIVRLAVAL